MKTIRQLIGLTTALFTAASAETRRQRHPRSTLCPTLAAVCAGGLLLLLEGSGRQVGAQVTLYPNQITGTIGWNNPAGTVKTHLDTQGFGTGTSDALVWAGQVAGPNTASKYFLPDSRTSTLYELTVNGSDTGIAYNVSPSMTMVSGDSYVFVPAVSGPVFYDTATHTPGLPVTLDFIECAGLIHVHFRNSSGAPVAVDSSSIVARLLNPSGPVQAQGYSVANSHADRRLIVRGGNTFYVKVSAEVHTGGDHFLDYVKLQPFDNYTVTVPCDGEVHITLTIPDLSGEPEGGYGQIIGRVDMLTENEHWINDTFTVMKAYEGPQGNYRLSDVGVQPTGSCGSPTSPFVGTPACTSAGQFVLPNLLPSDFYPNLNDPAGPRPYYLQGRLIYGTGQRFQIFETPALRAGYSFSSPVTVPAGGTEDLEDTFVMNPGWVVGDVYLCCPDEVGKTNSPLRYFRRISDHDTDHNGIPDTLGWDYTSQVLATGWDLLGTDATKSAVGAVGRTLFPGSFAAGYFVGDYRLTLGGLNGEATRWDQSRLVLNFLNEDPANYLSTQVIIGNNHFKDVEVIPTQTIINHHRYGMSRLVVNFHSDDPGTTLYHPRITGSGSFMGVFEGQAADYTAYIHYADGVPLDQASAATAGQIILCVPQGNYTFEPQLESVSGGSSTHNVLPGFTQFVGPCSSITSTPCLRIALTNAPDCPTNRQVQIGGSITSCTNVVASITYTLNSDPAVTLCNNCGVNPTFGFGLALADCDNHLTISATDVNGGHASYDVNLHFDVTPPVLSGCTTLSTNALAGVNGNFVSYTITALDNCDGPVPVICSPPSGSFFPVGNTLVACTAWDHCRNTNTCTFTVTVAGAGTNCCDTCTTNDYVSYTVVVQPGYNYLANVLCRGTNTFADLSTLLPWAPDMATAFRWDAANQVFGPAVQYYTGFGWDPNLTIPLGEGFVLYNPDVAYTNTFTGCVPDCPRPCGPTNGCQLVGAYSTGMTTWDDLYRCPPECGTTLSVWNAATQLWEVHTFLNGAWTPTAPVWPLGHSVMVCVQTNAACCTNNLVLNGSFELTDPVLGTDAFNEGLDPTSGVPGWTTGAGNYLEVWRNTFEGIPAAAGINQLEINAQSADQTVWQTITNLSTNCPASFCFDFTGRFGGVTNSPNNDFTVILTGGHALSVTLNPDTYTNGGWQRFCTNFIPTSSTLTIAFRGHPHEPVEGGAHIDNVTLTQCCDTNPCTAPTTLTCATNKSVECGSAWSFDPPQVNSPCCGTNVTLTSVDTVLSSQVCSNVVRRTWTLTDCQSKTVTCSQTVTVVDTTPPVLACPTNKLAVCGFGPVETGGSTYTVLRRFAGGTGDGANPRATVVEGTDGVLYGTTFAGGSGGVGTVFKLDPNGNGYATLKHFLASGTEGRVSAAPLIDGHDGFVYGTTGLGGVGGVGTVFKLGKNNGAYTTLWSFSSTGGDGQSPQAGLLEDRADPQILYGVANVGGSSGRGTIFKLKKDGTGYATLHHFSNLGGDGWGPQAALIEGSDGKLYGTTYRGGAGGGAAAGTVFKYDKNSGVCTVLASFPSTGPNGHFLRAGLVEGSGGWLFGTTSVGPGTGKGTVFKLKMDGTSPVEVLKHFATGTDGDQPWGTLILGADGALYGTTIAGGSENRGTIFKVNQDGSGFTVLKSLSAAAADGGSQPYAGLAKASDGALYGTTRIGGLGFGIVFKLECALAWSFDPPTVVEDRCGVSNVTLTVLSTVTNGACQQFITRTWGATDCCTNSATCSQTVTLLDARPLGITCLGSITTNILGTSAVVSYPNPTVTNGTLVGCMPPSGSVFPLGTTVVACTATNACGSNTCSFNVTVQQLSTNCLSFAGLEHCPLGAAGLKINANQLQVGNLGSSGQDGVKIAVPSSGGLDLHWTAPELSLDGDHLSVITKGIVNGVPDQPLSVATATRSSNVVLLSASFPALPSAEQSVELFLEGKLVAVYASGTSNLVVQALRSQTGGSGPAPAPCDYHTYIHWEADPIWVETIWSYHDIQDAGTGGPCDPLPIVVNDSLPVLADAVHFISASVSNSIESVVEVAITCKGPNELLIDAEALQVFRRPNAALGNARLGAQNKGGRLLVYNLGTNGNDGIQVQLDRPSGFGIGVNATSLWGQAGTCLRSVSHGHVGTGPALDLGVACLAGTSNGLALNVSFAPLGATTVRVKFYGLSNDLIRAEEIPDNGTIFLAAPNGGVLYDCPSNSEPQLSGGWIATGKCCPNQIWQTAWEGSCNPMSVWTANTPGSIVQAYGISVEPVNPASNSITLNTVAVTASNLNDFTVLWEGEEPPFVVEIVPLVSIERNGNNLNVNFEGKLQSASDLNGPWTTVASNSPLSLQPTGARQFYKSSPFLVAWGSASAPNPVWAVSWPLNITTVDPATGKPTGPGQYPGYPMIYDGNQPVSGPTGIAKHPTIEHRFTVSAIGPVVCALTHGTSFFFVDERDGRAVRLGILGGRTIRDIEYNPKDGILYGFEGNTLVKITSLGAACYAGTQGATPTVVPIGVPSSVGIGPYSVAFNDAGQCNIISARDHYRAIVDHTLPALPVLGSTRYQGLPTAMVNFQELAFCISMRTLMIGTIDRIPVGQITTDDRSFYYFTASGWSEKGNYCAWDYTAKPQDPNPVFHRKWR